MKEKPYVFIGSSREGLEAARGIQAELNYSCECEIWSQGTFGLSSGSLESLVECLNKFDFAILVLTADDIAISREDEQKIPRDNVIFELGLFIGGLGREKTFMVVEREAELKLPSDLAGIKPAFFQWPNRSSIQSALGPACLEIEQAIKRLGLFNQQNQEAHKADINGKNKILETPNFLNKDLNKKIFKIVSESNGYKITATYKCEEKNLDFNIINNINGKEFIVNTIYFETYYLDHSLIEKRLYDLSFTKRYIDEKFNVVLYSILLIITEEDIIQKIDYEKLKTKYRIRYFNTEIKLISTKNLNSELVKILFE